MKRSQHVPYHSLKCYACDNTARGVRDRRIEGGVVEAACKRHADPKIRAYAACIGCLGPRPTLAIDGQDLWHKSCHEEACR